MTAPTRAPFDAPEARALATAALGCALLEVLVSDWGGSSDDVWLRFEGSPQIRLSCASRGHGFSADREGPETSGAPVINSLADEPPFSAVMNTEVHAIGVYAFPEVVGFRLYFPRGSVSFVNFGDEIEIHDGALPYAAAYAWRYGLAEHTARTAEIALDTEARLKPHE